MPNSDSRICGSSCPFYKQYPPLVLCSALPDTDQRFPYNYHAISTGSSCRHGLTQLQIDALSRQERLTGQPATGPMLVSDKIADAALESLADQRLSNPGPGSRWIKPE